MITRVLCVLSLLLAAGFCLAQTDSKSGVPAEIPAFDVNAIDKTADPCVDFYQYSCGTWMKTNPIPADKSRWGRFDELAEHNLYILRDILNKLQATAKRSPSETMVGDFMAPAWTKARSRKKGDRSARSRTGENRRHRTAKTDLIRYVASMHRVGRLGVI